MLKIGIVLLSGGLDSTTVAAYAKKAGYDVLGITIFYGQRLKTEIYSAKKVAEKLEIKHKVIDISTYKELAWYSALTDIGSFQVPKKQDVTEIKDEIPITYVPMRNTFFIVLAAAYLESELLKRIEIDQVSPSEIDAKIFIAANVLDYSGYPDCRPDFYEIINKLLKIGSKVGTSYNLDIKIDTPILYKGKKEIVELGLKLNAPLEWSWSCYEGLNVPCGHCDSCLLRAKGFYEAGVEDPLLLRLKDKG